MAGYYQKEKSFGIHTDTGLYYNIELNQKSRWTLLIYLNDNFDGGETVFYDTNTWNKVCEIKPEIGKALLFDIDLWHSGSPIVDGEKYWIGCEIIGYIIIDNINNIIYYNIIMSIPQITALSLIEIVGDYGAKQFANLGGIKNLGIGIAGYIGVFTMLIVSLQGSTLLMVNAAWDGISGLLNSIFAFFVLGERLDHWSQYFGILLIIAGIYLLKVPISKELPFTWPSL